MTQLELPFSQNSAATPPEAVPTIVEVISASSPCREIGRLAPLPEDVPGAPVVPSSDKPEVAATIPARPAEIMAVSISLRPNRAGNHVELPPLVLEKKPETLDKAIAVLREVQDFDPKLLKRLSSDVRMATKLVHRSIPSENTRPVSLPCAPAMLREYLAQVLPARYRMKPKRWSSIRSSAVMVLKLTGWHASNADLHAPLTPDWQAVAEMICTRPQRALVAALGRFCERQGVLPAAVTEETLEQFKAWRSENTLDLHVRQNIQSLRGIWNRAKRTNPNWPGRHLAPPPDPRRYVLPKDQFAPRFLADLDAYLARLQAPNPFDPVFNREKAPLTLTDIRGTLLRAASVLMSRGISITSIRDVVVPESYKAVLLEAYERLSDGKRWPNRAVSTASYLFAAARDWAQLSPEQLAEVTKLRKMVKAPAAEMTQKSRDRIAQFDDPRLLAAFFELPYELFGAADRMFKEGKPKKAARLHQLALALAILQVKPLRRKNLASLEHGRHLLAKSGRQFGELRIPGTEVKSGAQLQAAIPKHLSRRIEKHIAVYRPLIATVPCRFLFPNPLGNHIADRTLAQNLTKLVQKQIGAVFNVHVVRHLTATLLLDEDQDNLPVAQALLGHSDSKTTARFYAQQRTRGAQLKWMQTLEKRIKNARRGPPSRSSLPAGLAIEPCQGAGP